eukprot:RCo010697
MEEGIVVPGYSYRLPASGDLSDAIPPSGRSFPFVRSQPVPKPLSNLERERQELNARSSFIFTFPIPEDRVRPTERQEHRLRQHHHEVERAVAEHWQSKKSSGARSAPAVETRLRGPAAAQSGRTPGPGRRTAATDENVPPSAPATSSIRGSAGCRSTPATPAAVRGPPSSARGLPKTPQRTASTSAQVAPAPASAAGLPSPEVRQQARAVTEALARLLPPSVDQHPRAAVIPSSSSSSAGVTAEVGALDRRAVAEALGVREEDTDEALV